MKYIEILKENKISNIVKPIVKLQGKELSKIQKQQLEQFKIEVKNILSQQERITNHLDNLIKIKLQQIKTEQKIIETTKQQFDTLGKLFVENNDKIIVNLRKFFNEYKQQGEGKFSSSIKSLIATYKEKKLGISHLYKLKKSDLLKIGGLKLLSTGLHVTGLATTSPLFNIAASKINDFSKKIIQEKYQKTREEFEKLINENKQRYEELAREIISHYDEIKNEKKKEFEQRKEKSKQKIETIAKKQAIKQAKEKEFKDREEYIKFVERTTKKLIEEYQDKLKSVHKIWEKEYEKEEQKIENEKLEHLKSLGETIKKETISQMNNLNEVMKKSNLGEIDIEKGAKAISNISNEILKTHLEQKRKELENEKLLHLSALEFKDLSKEEKQEHLKAIEKIDNELKNILIHFTAIKKSEEKGTLVKKELEKIEKTNKNQIQKVNFVNTVEIKPFNKEEKLSKSEKNNPIEEKMEKELKNFNKGVSKFEKPIKETKKTNEILIKQQKQLIEIEKHQEKLQAKEFEWEKAQAENKELQFEADKLKIKTPLKEKVSEKYKNIKEHGFWKEIFGFSLADIIVSLGRKILEKIGVFKLIDFFKGKIIDLLKVGKNTIFNIGSKVLLPFKNIAIKGLEIGKGLIGKGLEIGKGIIPKFAEKFGGKALLSGLGGIAERFGLKAIAGSVLGAFELSNPIGWIIGGATLLLDKHVREFLWNIGKGLWKAAKSIFSFKNLKKVGSFIFNISPIGLAYKGIKKLIHSTLFKKIGHVINKVWNDFKSIFSPKNIWKGIKTFAKFSPFGLAFEGFEKLFHSEFFDNLKKGILNIKTKITDFVKEKIDSVKNFFSGIGKGIFNIFHHKVKKPEKEKVKPISKTKAKENSTTVKEKTQIEKVKEQIKHHYHSSQVIQTIKEINKETVKEKEEPKKTQIIPSIPQPSINTEKSLINITTGDENSIPSILFKHFYFIGG